MESGKFNEYIGILNKFTRARNEYGELGKNQSGMFDSIRACVKEKNSQLTTINGEIMFVTLFEIYIHSYLKDMLAPYLNENHILMLYNRGYKLCRILGYEDHTRDYNNIKIIAEEIHD